MMKLQRGLLLAVSLLLPAALLVLSLALAQGAGSFTRITAVSDSNRDSNSGAISADGTRIVFSSDSDFLGQGIPAGQNEIWLYDTNSMTLTRVTSASHSDRNSFSPHISADGTKLVFRSDSDFLGQGIPDGQAEIWLYDTDSMALTRVTTALDSSRWSRDPEISADGTKIVFRTDADLLGQGIADDQFEVWLYDTNSMTVTRITTASHNSRDSSGPDISADGTKIAFRSDSDFLGQGIPAGQFEIWLYDTDSMALTRVTTASGNSRDSFEPDINADGTQVAFHSDSDFLGQGISDEQREIWLYDTGSMTLTRITTASHNSRNSRDSGINVGGTKIIFNSDSDFLGQGIPEGQNEIWLYDTNSMTLTRLTTASSSDRDSTEPRINADGTKFAFESDSDFLGQGIPNDQFEIWLWAMSTDTPTPTPTPSATPTDTPTPTVTPSATPTIPGDTPVEDIYLPLTMKNYCDSDDTLICAIGPILSGVTYIGMQEDVTDYYFVDLSTPGDIQVTVTGFQPVGDLILRDESGQALDSWGQGGSTMQVSAVGLAPGKYYIQIFNPNVISTNVYNLVATFP